MVLALQPRLDELLNKGIKQNHIDLHGLRGITKQTSNWMSNTLIQYLWIIIEVVVVIIAIDWKVLWELDVC